MNLHDQTVRGESAKQVLQSAVYKEAWKAYEGRLLDELANADRSAEQAEKLRGLLIASRKARAHLERIMNEGAYAARQIELEEQRRKWFQRRSA